MMVEDVEVAGGDGRLPVGTGLVGPANPSPDGLGHSATIPSARPRQSDPAIQAAAIAALAKDCANWDGDPVDDWAWALGKCRLSDNGYEIARDLERYAGVSPDAELVEILDSASSHVWLAHRAAVSKWVEEGGIRPALAVGTRLRHPRWGEGVINRVDEQLAVYLFVPDSEPQKYGNGGGIHVPYEEALAPQADAQGQPA